MLNHDNGKQIRYSRESRIRTKVPTGGVSKGVAAGGEIRQTPPCRRAGEAESPRREAPPRITLIPRRVYKAGSMVAAAGGRVQQGGSRGAGLPHTSLKDEGLGCCLQVTEVGAAPESPLPLLNDEGQRNYPHLTEDGGEQSARLLHSVLKKDGQRSSTQLIEPGECGSPSSGSFRPFAKDESQRCFLKVTETGGSRTIGLPQYVLKEEAEKKVPQVTEAIASGAVGLSQSVRRQEGQRSCLRVMVTGREATRGSPYRIPSPYKIPQRNTPSPDRRKEPAGVTSARNKSLSDILHRLNRITFIVRNIRNGSVNIEPAKMEAMEKLLTSCEHLLSEKSEALKTGRSERAPCDTIGEETTKNVADNLLTGRLMEEQGEEEVEEEGDVGGKTDKRKASKIPVAKNVDELKRRPSVSAGSSSHCLSPLLPPPAAPNRVRSCHGMVLPEAVPEDTEVGSPTSKVHTEKSFYAAVSDKLKCLISNYQKRECDVTSGTPRSGRSKRGSADSSSVAERTKYRKGHHVLTVSDVEKRVMGKILTAVTKTTGFCQRDSAKKNPPPFKCGRAERSSEVDRERGRRREAAGKRPPSDPSKEGSRDREGTPASGPSRLPTKEDTVLDSPLEGRSRYSRIRQVPRKTASGDSGAPERPNFDNFKRTITGASPREVTKHCRADLVSNLVLPECCECEPRPSWGNDNEKGVQTVEYLGRQTCGFSAPLSRTSRKTLVWNIVFEEEGGEPYPSQEDMIEALPNT